MFSVWEVSIVASLWAFAGFVCAWWIQRQKIDALHRELADMKALDRLTKVINA